LSDLKLDIDEYENIIQAREDLGLSKQDVLTTEQRICMDLLHQKVNGIIDVLGGSDLESFKKLDRVRENRPDWVNRCLENVSASSNNLLKNYVHYYFNGIQVETEMDCDSMFSILGCWQGWYFQYAAKTYFDLLFLAKKENEFIGLSIEPINPKWTEKGYQDPYLLAWIEGSLADDILFSYEKTMILEKTWSVDYEGVIIENGQLFEGEWRINSLNGSFNAMRTKSLLPIRIFDTTNQRPIVPSTYLNKSRDLTSSWLIQITGKTSITGILHVIELRKNIYANLVIPFEDKLCISYCEGKYDELAKVTLYEVNNIKGQLTNFSITFTIDWNNLILNGIMKDDIYRMRVFKGFKL
jgi:hypothetical protein